MAVVVVRYRSTSGSKIVPQWLPNKAMTSRPASSRYLVLCHGDQWSRRRRSGQIQNSSRPASAWSVPSGQAQPQKTRPRTSVSATSPSDANSSAGTACADSRRRDQQQRVDREKRLQPRAGQLPAAAGLRRHDQTEKRQQQRDLDQPP